ncbi:MAG: hydroxyacylglutathione hydrolase [Novosphingobium sp.]
MVQFACLEDNYGFLLRDNATGEVACIDTPDAAAITRELDRLGWTLSVILNTHWHPDHAGGNAAINDATGAVAIGPAEVGAHYRVDRVVGGGDTITLGETAIAVIEAGGHTLGHVVYYLAGEQVLFAGDTLFPMGCGRIFEGTASQMWSSLSRLAQLPPSTTVYSAHEYALGNARFALSVDPRPEVLMRAVAIQAARARGEATVPTTIGEECATNPFLRAPGLALARGSRDDAEAFARVRMAKDSFRG